MEDTYLDFQGHYLWQGVKSRNRLLVSADGFQCEWFVVSKIG